MAVILGTLIITQLIKITTPNLSGNVFRGIESKITDFPYSAYLSIGCKSDKGEGVVSCGSSIVHQAVLLTAGHCLLGCEIFSFAVAIVGHERRDKGIVIDVISFKVHDDFVEGLLSNDIALVLLNKDLRFNKRVSRVALMKKPLKENSAIIAGWGRVNGQTSEVSAVLKHTHQRVMPQQTCLFIQNNPIGTICAESKQYGVPSEADSGSALVVLRFIQIGLVSYINPKIAADVTIYTDINYFYDWIKENIEMLYCE